jgi:hypothetical protein
VASRGHVTGRFENDLRLVIVSGLSAHARPIDTFTDNEREQSLSRQSTPIQDMVLSQESRLESFYSTRQAPESAPQAQLISERVQSMKIPSHSLDLEDKNRGSMRSLTYSKDDTSGGPPSSTTRRRLRRSRPHSRVPAVVHPLSVALDSSMVNGRCTSQEAIDSQPSTSRTSKIRWWHKLASSLGLLDTLPRVELKPPLRPLLLASSATVAFTPKQSSSTRSVTFGK